jgi:hypothetical protein
MMNELDILHDFIFSQIKHMEDSRYSEQDRARLQPYRTAGSSRDPMKAPKYLGRIEKANYHPGQWLTGDALLDEKRHARLSPKFLSELPTKGKEVKKRHVNMKPLPDTLLYELADHDISFNPAMASYAGAKNWCDVHPGYSVEVDDKNSDGIPEILVVGPEGQTIWACGYRIKQSDRPYRDWYQNEKAMNPTGFKEHEMNLRKFRDDLYHAETNYKTGYTHIPQERRADIEKFENYIRKKGYQVKKV